VNLTFVGSGAAFNPAMGNSNAFFTAGDRLYIVDCGEAAFARLWDLPALRDSRQVTVAITHLHCDHVGSLGSLISYCYFVLGKTVRVLHPLDTIVALLDLMGIERACYTYVRRLPDGPAEEPIAFEPVLVAHVDNMTCFGYIITTPAGRIYFSGDAKSVPAEVVTAFRRGHIDRIYQDTGLRANDHPTHGTLAYMEATFAPDLRARVFCMHLDCDFRSLVREKGFGVVEVLPERPSRIGPGERSPTVRDRAL
jgi:ribonuclease BN (tRNA processing enzyme)